MRARKKPRYITSNIHIMENLCTHLEVINIQVQVEGRKINHESITRCKKDVSVMIVSYG